MKDTEREYLLERIASLADTLHKECLELNEAIDETWDAETVSKRVGRYEEDADEVYHEIQYYCRDQGLLTDEETKYYLAMINSIEELTDLVDELAKDLVRYNVTVIRDNAVVSFANCVSASTKLCQIVLSLRQDKNINHLFKDSLELDHFKVEAGKLYDRQLNRLFTTETDPIEVIRWQNIYRSFMGVFAGFEKVAETFARHIVNNG